MPKRPRTTRSTFTLPLRNMSRRKSGTGNCRRSHRTSSEKSCRNSMRRRRSEKAAQRRSRSVWALATKAQYRKSTIYTSSMKNAPSARSKKSIVTFPRITTLERSSPASAGQFQALIHQYLNNDSEDKGIR